MTKTTRTRDRVTEGSVTKVEYEVDEPEVVTEEIEGIECDLCGQFYSDEEDVDVLTLSPPGPDVATFEFTRPRELESVLSVAEVTWMADDPTLTEEMPNTGLVGTGVKRSDVIASNAVSSLGNCYEHRKSSLHTHFLDQVSAYREDAPANVVEEYPFGLVFELEIPVETDSREYHFCAYCRENIES